MSPQRFIYITALLQFFSLNLGCTLTSPGNASQTNQPIKEQQMTTESPTNYLPSKNPEKKQSSKNTKIKLPPELNQQLADMGYQINDEPKRRSSTQGTPYETADLSHILDNTLGTFVFYDLKRDLWVIHNETRADTPFSPCSTFKIPHMFIALETAVATDKNSKIKWQSSKYPKQPWWDELKINTGYDWTKDHTLKSAFQNSVVWYFQETAAQIGPAAMQSFLNAFNYGNKDISSGQTSFWLDGSLKISAIQQVQFLTRFIQKKLRLKESTRQNGLDIFKHATNGPSALYAKTGGGNNIGWFVGFVQTQNEYYIFAFNMPGTFEQTSQRKIEASKAALAELGVWI